MMIAANATFVPGGGDRDGVLTLDGFDDETIAFTDRPGRDAYPIATADFVAAAFAPVDSPEDDSFYADPPNAAFSCPLGSGGVARAVYVLRAPSESDSDVAFEVEVLYASAPGAIECDGPAVRPRRPFGRTSPSYGHWSDVISAACRIPSPARPTRRTRDPDAGCGLELH